MDHRHGGAASMTRSAGPRPLIPRARRGAAPATALLAVALLLGGGAFLARHAGRAPGAPAAGDRARTVPQDAPTVREALGTFAVRDVRGRVVPLVPAGEPAIVMISSRTCVWCKRVLKDLGEMAGGRPLPRLRLLTLEGAGEGAPMVSRERIAGAVLLGPAGSADQVQLTFRYPGTPTLLAIDRRGRVVRTLPGYPIREELRHWFAVMAGEQDIP